MKRIVVPATNQSAIHPRVHNFLIEVDSARDDVEVVKVNNALPDRARNAGILGGYNNVKWPIKYITRDVYIFIDSDVLPDKNSFFQQLDVCDADTCVSGLYECRGGGTYAVGTISGPNVTAIKKKDIRNFSTVDWAGGGLFFVGANHIKRIANPFFTSGVVSWKDDQGVERSEIIGEDVVFSMKLVKSGAAITINHKLKAQHFWEEDTNGNIQS